MGWTADLVEGVGQHLAANNLGVWRTTGPYTATEIGIAVGAAPQTPDRIITLTGYTVSDEVELPLSVIGVQVRTRGTTDPRSADNLADPVFDLLHNASRLTLGGVYVSLIQRRSSAPMGRDANGRWERSDNYYLTCQRPSAHRPES